jgi:hypothetical protein
VGFCFGSKLMPKRVIDGEGLWRSDKLTQVQPPGFRSEYANLLPLALANGVFEANARRIWSTVYSYNRPEITLEHVNQILAEFERVKLLFRWTDPQSVKVWGYWIGIDKPGRLPAPSRLRQGHEILGPEPPSELVQDFLSNGEQDGQPLASQPLAHGSIGFGSCIGSCLGSEDGSPMASQEEKQLKSRAEQSEGFNSIEVARALCSENGWSGQKMIWTLKDAIEFQAKQIPEDTLEQVGEWLVQAYRAHRSSQGKYAVGPQKFFGEGRYQSSDPSPSQKTNLLTDNPATRAQAQMEGD